LLKSSGSGNWISGLVIFLKSGFLDIPQGPR